MPRFGILGNIVLFLSFIQIVRSLDCYQCNSYSTVGSQNDDEKALCKDLDMNKTMSSMLLLPCKEQELNNTSLEISDKEQDLNTTSEVSYYKKMVEKIPVCITLEYQVLQRFAYNAGEVQYIKEMKKPSYRRMCGFARKGSEIGGCISRGGSSSKFIQCTCTEPNGCNNKSFGSTSYLWIYLLTIFIALAAAIGISYFVYRKTGCNFDK